MLFNKLLKIAYVNRVQTFSSVSSNAQNCYFCTIQKLQLSVGSLQKLLVKLRAMAPKSRENPVIMRLDSPQFKSVFTNELVTLASLFKENGYEIRIAGGAVRDLLAGKTPKDLDFATTATPTQMKDMFLGSNIRLINENGEKHGTITPRINDKENFEVTTLRVDVATDGRHAEVEYTTDWFLDANRRDLTINSMFLDLDGNVYDYFYGYDDLQKNRVAFVGDPTIRIKEDFLRILRYFRFYGRIAKEPNAHEQDVLNKIKENGYGLANISGERIWMELKLILEGNYAGEILGTILDCDLAPYIGLPRNGNVEEMHKVWRNGKNLQMNSVVLLAALLKNQEESMKLHARMKFSAFERDLISFLIEHREPKLHPNPLIPYKQLALVGKPGINRLYAIELLKYINSPHLREFDEWKMPKFPISGNALKERGVKVSPQMGAIMNELKKRWALSDFTLDTDELLKELPAIMSMLEENKLSRKK